MSTDAKAIPGEVVVSPDPLTLAKRAVRGAWLYAGLLLGALGVLGGVFRHSLSWGDVATWIGSITTLLALVAATFAGIVAYDLLKVENARDLAAAQARLQDDADRRQANAERAAQREAARRAQASKVAAWFELYVADDQVNFVWGAAVRNASELPILDVRVFFYWVTDPHDGSPWTAEQRYASIDRLRVIPPDQTRHLMLPDRVQAMAEQCNDQVYLVGIEFTDANGSRWIRDERGALHDPQAASSSA
jgi:hypothetical protein